MKETNKIYLLLTAVLLGVMFSTFGKAVSIDRRGLVHAMGIDKAPEGYSVTVQIFKPGGAGADTAVDISRTNVSTVSGVGSTVSEAVAQCRAVSGKELFFGHLQVICLGRDVDMSDIEQLFAYALGDKNISPTAQICLAQGKASDIMEAKLSTEETSAEALLSMLRVSEEYGHTVGCTMRDMLSDGERSCTAMPVLEMHKASGGGGEKQEDDKVEPVGTVIIKDGKVCGKVIPSREGQEIAMLCAKAKKGSITAELDGRQISCALEDNSIKRSMTAQGGRLKQKFVITVTARPDLDISPDENDPLAQQISDKIRKRCEGVLAQHLKNGEDIFDITQMIKHRYPKVWLRYKDRNDELLKLVDTEVKVKVKVG